MKRLFKDMSIRYKILGFMIIFVLIPYVAINVFVYVKLTDNETKIEYHNQMQRLNLATQSVNLKMQEFEGLLASTYNHPNVINVLKKQETDMLMKDYILVPDTMRKIYKGTEHIGGMYIFGVNGQVFVEADSGGEPYLSLYSENKEWQDKMQNSKRPFTVISTFRMESALAERVSKNSFFTCAMRLYDVNSSLDYVGQAVINVQTTVFDELFEDVDFGDKNYFVISDSVGNIIWSNEKTEIGGKLAPATMDSVHRYADNDLFDITHKGGEYVATSILWQPQDWYITSMTHRDNFLLARRWIKTMVGTQVTVLGIFFLIALYFVNHHITTPIQKMTVMMGLKSSDRVRMMHTHLAEQNDEIGRLFQSFKNMDNRINTLLDDMNEAHKKETDYHIKALQAQINPHFIYNTLDTVRWMAVEQEQNSIGNIVVSLSNILRYSINGETKLVSLRDEVACLKEYLNIYTERYEGAFKVQYAIDEEIYAYYTFRLLLQPIAENCIAHGFKNNIDAGIIRVTGRLEHGCAIVEIEDNGCGMEQDRVYFALSSESERIGLKNINQRLKLLYGSEYGLQIDSQKGKGTTVRVTIPRKIMDENGEVVL